MIIPSSDTRFFDLIEGMPRPELERLQDERLLSMLPFAYEKSRLVREAWKAAGITPEDIRSRADFQAKVPFLDKDTIRAAAARTGDPFGGQRCIPLEALSCIGSSSGTTGDPTFFSELLGPQGDPDDPATLWFEVYGPGWWTMWVRGFWELGLRPGKYLLSTYFRLRGPGSEYSRFIGSVPIYIDMNAEAATQVVEMSRIYRPTILFALNPAILFGLEQFEKAAGVDLADVFASYESVVWTGEPLSPRQRATLSRWGLAKRINDHTSFGDVGVTFDCREQSGFHATEDSVLVECLDPETGKAVPDGQRGELVVTSLVDRVDPLIRYRAGDLIELDRARCRCGRTHARFRVVGRTNDEIVIGGKSVLPLDIRFAIETLDETASALFQIIRTSRTPDCLKLRVGFSGASDLAALERRLKAVIADKIGMEPDILLVPNDYFLRFGAPHKIPRTSKE